MPLTVALSASFGAGGNVLGPAVAERLGLPFFDRAIPAAVAARLAVPIDEAAAQDERAPSTWARLAGAFANVAAPMAPQNLDPGEDADRFRAQTEGILRQIADSTGGVVLGRGAAVVLGGRHDVLRVRLHGDAVARARRVAVHEGLAPETARRMQRETDEARNHYLRLFYRVRPHDPALYDLVVDSIRIPLEVCTELIVLAAGDLGRAGGDD